MKKLVALALFAGVLSGCQKPYQGTLEVKTEAFRVRTAQGRYVILWQGGHPAKATVSMTKSGETTVAVKFDASKTDLKSFKMNLGKMALVAGTVAGVETYEASSSQSGQIFDTTVTMQDKGTVSEIVEYREDCSKNDGPIPTPMFRTVRYEKVTTEKTVEAVFTDGAQELGQYNGSQQQVDYKLVKASKCGETLLN